MSPRFPLRWALVLAVGLSACGGGGGGGGNALDVSASPGTSTTQFLVAPKPGEDIAEIAAGLGAAVLGPVPGTSYWRVAVPAGMGPDDAVGRMRGDRRVRAAEEDVGMSTPEGGGSTLPAGGLLLASAIPAQPEIVRIGGEVARLRAAGRGVRVAVVDTGILVHPFVDANVDPDGWDVLADDPDPTDDLDGRDDDGDDLVDEAYGHGLFVASLVVAIAPEVRIVPIRALDADGVGRASLLAAAVGLAAERGVDVINLSVGMVDDVGVLREAVERARAVGVLVVASAGNSGGGDVEFPAALPEVFSVTAGDGLDARADFASFGGEVDLLAPGVDLLGAWPSPSGTGVWSGTSFSAAIVSGSLALLRELRPLDLPEDLLLHLQGTAAPIAEPDPVLRDLLGAGRLDLEAATAP